MIRISLDLDTNSFQELQFAYLHCLLLIGAVGIGREDLWQYLSQKSSSVSNANVSLADRSNAQAIIRENDPGLYEFLFPDGRLEVQKLVWLLVGIPPDGREFLSMRENLEDIIREVEAGRNGFVQNKENLNAIKTIFDYSSLSTINKGLSEELGGELDTAYWLQHQLKVRTCPYCNANYTRVSFPKAFRADLEHFFPRSEYPYLSVSLFNLFPACQTCNKLKSDKANRLDGEEILYPYSESFDENAQERIPFRFVIDKEASPVKVLSGISDQFSIRLVPVDDTDCFALDAAMTLDGVAERRKKKEKTAPYWDRAIRAIHLFQLDEVYKYHKPEVQKLLRILYIYNHAAREQRSKLLPEKEHYFLQLPPLADLLFANLEKEHWGDMPLNKLKADIVEQVTELENQAKIAQEE